jgi:hypothetical protein
VTHLEHPEKTTRAKAGLLARVCVSLRRPGMGPLSVASRHNARTLLATLGMGFACLLVIGVTPALATVSYPPQLPQGLDCRGTSHTSLRLNSVVDANSLETHWSFSYSTTKGGPWTSVPGGSGTITKAEAESLGNSFGKQVDGDLTGLIPEVPYYALITAENSKGIAQKEAGPCEVVPLHASPSVSGIAAVTLTSAHIAGKVAPNGSETHWRFQYATSEAGPWSAGPAGTVTQAEAETLEAEGPGFGKTVEGDVTGLQSGKIYYLRLFAESEPEFPQGSGERHHKEATSGLFSFETPGPPTVATFVVHSFAPGSETIRVLGSVKPDGYDTHYHVQYVSQEQFAATGWAGASETAGVDLGAGASSKEGNALVFDTQLVGLDLPGLEAGKTYRYRFVATNTTPGNPVIDGNEQTLTVPGAREPVEEGCANAAFRTGPSGHLPDCRAYEQVTPVDKQNAIELFNYGGEITPGGLLVGEDGDHAMVQDELIDWGVDQGPYFFTRTEGGWRMVAGEPQAEGGISRYTPQLFTANLDQFAFSSGWTTGTPTSENVEFRAGAPGGPYATIASVPRSELGPEPNGWVAGSPDFGKLILQVEDHTLLGHATGTISGSDLYEYSEGQLRQLNVAGGSPGSPIGACGARVAHGQEVGGAHHQASSSRHTISADGSRVFFEAVPGSDCSQPAHLYMRIDGAETIDLGAYRFAAANAAGSDLLLEAHSGEARELLLYDGATASTKPLFSVHGSAASEPLQLTVSEDFSTFYLSSTGRLTSEAPPISPETDGGIQVTDLYRYDIARKTLGYVAQASEFAPGFGGTTRDGRYLYFESRSVAGVPGAPRDPEQEILQVYRYDSATDSVECLSCASPFDPEPTLRARFGGSGDEARVAESAQGMPKLTSFSADGRYAFFDTPSALVPQDVDGEEEPLDNQSSGRGINNF